MSARLVKVSSPYYFVNCERDGRQFVVEIWYMRDEISHSKLPTMCAVGLK